MIIWPPGTTHELPRLSTWSVFAMTLLLVGCAISADETSEIAKTVDDAETKPNIILILADDMGYSDISSYGGEIDTPNIDRLAQNGIRFSSFYNTARCSTTRASLLTGLYSHQAGLGSMPNLPLIDDEPSYRGDFNSSLTLAEVLRPAGYATYMVGKWHITPYLHNNKSSWPLQRGFDRFYGTITGAGSYFEPTTLTDGNNRIHATDDRDFYYTDQISKRASTFITDHLESSSDKPFFLYLAYTAPHWPLHAPNETIAKYKGKYDIGWDAVREQRISRLKDLGIIDENLVLTPRDLHVDSWDDASDKKWYARAMEVYAAQVDHLDKGIGEVLAVLEMAGELDNTLILFLSDNGAAAEVIEPDWAIWITGDDEAAGIRTTRDGVDVAYGNDTSVLPGDNDSFQSYGVAWANASNTPFRGYKKQSYEGGTETPFIMHWPKGLPEAGKIVRHPGHVIDVMPTLIEIASASYGNALNSEQSETLVGVNLLGPDFDESAKDRALFFEHYGDLAVRAGTWKAVFPAPEGPWELYDMQSDPTELNDISSSYPDRLNDMRQKWLGWADRVGARVPSGAADETQPDFRAEQLPPGTQLEKCGIVLDLGSGDDWDAGMIESPAVWQDPSTGRYGMVYTGYDLQNEEIQGYGSVGVPRVGLAWSDDLERWEKDPRNPIFEASGVPESSDEKGATGPYVWLEDGLYHLYYIGTTREGYEAGRKTLNLATSTDLITWKRYEGNPIIAPAGNGWRSEDIWHPNIVKVDGVYYLFFNASGIVDGHHEEFTGYATSTDLFNWTVDDDNSPLIVGSREAGTWDSTGRAGDPSLYRVGDNWYMAYYSWDGKNAQDGLAITKAADFPLGWEPYEGNPVLRIGDRNSVDAIHAHKPFIYRTDNAHYHFYTAVDGMEARQIALAKWPGPCQ